LNSRKINNKTLLLFTETFPYNTAEVFLETEIIYLAHHFEKIMVFPLYYKDPQKTFKVPANVSVVHFDVFAPYSRPQTFFKNLFAVLNVFSFELIHSKNRWNYLKNTRKHLENLLHKISNAKKLSTYLKLNSSSSATCYVYWFNQWTLIANLLKIKFPKTTILNRGHGSDIYEYAHREPGFFFPFRSFQMEHINTIATISEHGKDYIKRTRPDYKGNFSVSRLGVQDNGTNPSLSNEIFTLVSCSALVKLKRVHLIAEILKHIPFKIKWIHFGDGPEISSIKEAIKTLPENIKVELKGHIFNEQLMHFYKSTPVDLFINVSETEGLPVSLMEAISFGIPILAPNIGGVSEIATKETGYLIEKDFDPKEIAQIIICHEQKPSSEIENLRNSAKRFYSENFNAEKNYKDFIKNNFRNC
jgi:glycosyltransferase involved in cell wall biosynthesis